MACDHVRMRDGTVAVVCTRGKRTSRAWCDTPGCTNVHVALCDYPVVRRGKKGTCDRKMCESCRHEQPKIAHCSPEIDTVDFCGPHHKMAADEKAR